MGGGGGLREGEGIEMGRRKRSGWGGKGRGIEVGRGG